MIVNLILEEDGIRRGPTTMDVSNEKQLPSSSSMLTTKGTTLSNVMELLHQNKIPSKTWNVPQVEFYCVVKGPDRCNPKAIGWRFKSNLSIHLYVKEEEYLVMKPVPPPVSEVTVSSFEVDTIKNILLSTKKTSPQPEFKCPSYGFTLVKMAKPLVLSNQTNFVQATKELSTIGKIAQKAVLTPTNETGNRIAGSTMPKAIKDNQETSDLAYAPGSHHFLSYKDGVDYPVIVVKEVRSKKLLVRYLPPFGRTTATVTKKQLLEPTKERLYAYEQALEITNELQSQTRAKQTRRQEATKKRSATKLLTKEKGGRPKKVRPKKVQKCNIESESKPQKAMIDSTKKFGQPIGHQNLPNYSESIVFQPHLNRKVYFANKGETIQGISKKLNVAVERLIHDNRCIAPEETWSSRTTFRAFTPIVAPYFEASDLSHTDDDIDWNDLDDVSHGGNVTKELPSRQTRNVSSFCDESKIDEEHDDDDAEYTVTSKPTHGKDQGNLSEEIESDYDDDDTVTECTLPKPPKRRSQCSVPQYVFSDDSTDDDESSDEDTVNVCTQGDPPLPPRQSHPAFTPEKVITEFFLEDTSTSEGNAIVYDGGFVI